MTVADEFVWMRHPDTGGVQKFAPDAVPAWQEMGWEPCDPPAEPNRALDPNRPTPLTGDRTEPTPAGRKTTTRRTTATAERE